MNELLPQSEKPMVLFRVRKSKIFLIWPLVMVIFAGILLLSMYFYLVSSIFSDPYTIGMIAILIFVCFTFAGFVVVIDWLTTYYVLTEQTIEVQKEFFSYNKTYMSLHDLSRIECQSGIIGHTFDFGSVEIESETSERPMHLRGVQSPHQVIDLIRQARAHVAGSDK